MEGAAFEELVAELFERQGYTATHTPPTGDQGADVILERAGYRTVVQVKRSSGAIGNTAVQEVVAACAHYTADRAMVLTNARFTRGARELASSNNVELIDRDGLRELLG